MDPNIKNNKKIFTDTLIPLLNSSETTTYWGSIFIRTISAI